MTTNITSKPKTLTIVKNRDAESLRIALVRLPVESDRGGVSSLPSARSAASPGSTASFLAHAQTRETADVLIFAIDIITDHNNDCENRIRYKFPLPRFVLNNN